MALAWDNLRASGEVRVRTRLRVASVSEMPSGSAKEVYAAGRIIALFNVDGTFYALDGVCPHQGGPLGQGTLQHRILTCPWHGWQFDVTTGRHLVNPHIVQERLEVLTNGDDVFLVVDQTG
ncbi:MAG: Rieske (2Fe-2S) protein [Planctomycetes bacterium]|nr:Rieske (2Fe-2S) protein [Planctomycetota bacterium]